MCSRSREACTGPIIVARKESGKHTGTELLVVSIAKTSFNSVHSYGLEVELQGDQPQGEKEDLYTAVRCCRWSRTGVTCGNALLVEMTVSGAGQCYVRKFWMDMTDSIITLSNSVELRG